jgi:hypothetical protein
LVCTRIHHGCPRVTLITTAPSSFALPTPVGQSCSAARPVRI